MRYTNHHLVSLLIINYFHLSLSVRLANPGPSQPNTEQKKRSVAKKSTGGGTTSINLDSDKSKSNTGWEPPWLKKQQQQQQNKAQKKNVTGGSIQTSKGYFSS